MLPCSLLWIKYVILRLYLTITPAYELNGDFTVSLYNVWDNGGVVSVAIQKQNQLQIITTSDNPHGSFYSCNVTLANDWSNSKFTN